MKRSPLRRVSRLRAVSPKRVVQNRAYRSLRARFLTENPWCWFPGCGRRSQDVHHKRGRIGALLLAVRIEAHMSSRAKRRYPCAYCPEQFGNHPRRKKHIDLAHPEHRNAAPAWIRATVGTPRQARPTLKRATDVWPGRA